jgi:hypothetical protein
LFSVSSGSIGVKSKVFTTPVLKGTGRDIHGFLAEAEHLTCIFDLTQSDLLAEYRLDLRCRI